MAARGIGAFINGMFEGYQWGENNKQRKKDSERRDRLDDIAEEQREIENKRNSQRDGWLKQDHDWTVSERNRAAADREKLNGIFEEGARRTDDAMTGPVETAPPPSTSRGAIPRDAIAGAAGDDSLAGDAGSDRFYAPIPRDPSGRPIVPERDGAESAGGYVPTQEDLDLKYRSEQRNGAVAVDRVPAALEGPPVRRAPRGAMGPVDSMPPPRAGQPDQLRRQDVQDAPPQGISNLPSAPMTEGPTPAPGYAAEPPRARDRGPARAPTMQGAPSAPDAALSRGATSGLPPPVDVADAAPTFQQNNNGTKEERAQLAADTREVLKRTATPSGDSLADKIEDQPKEPRGTLEGERQRRASKVAGSWMDEYARTGAPYVAEQLARMGRLDDAKNYQTWIDSEETKRGMESYAKAAYFAAQGDMDSFGESVLDLYNNEGYFSDGLTMDKEQSQFETDDDGNITGAEVVFRDSEGQEFVQRWETMDEMVMDVLNMLNPEQAFETRIANIGKAADVRTDAAKREADFADFVRKEAVKANLKGGDVKRITETTKELAEELGGMTGEGAWATMTEEEKMQAVLARIEAQDAAAARIGTGAAREPTAPPVAPEPLRRPG